MPVWPVRPTLDHEMPGRPSRSVVLAAVLAAAYLVAFPWLYAAAGVTAGVATFAPVVALAWTLGLRQAALAGLLTVPLNALAYGRVGLTYSEEPMRSGLLAGTIAWTAVGCLVAYARQLARRSAAQAEALARALADAQRHQAALNAERDRVQTLLEAQSALGEGVAIGRGQRFEWANDALLAATGYTLERLRALPSVYDIVAPEDREALRAAVAEPSAQRRIVRVVHADNSTFPIEIAIRVIRHEDGRRGFVFVARDVTARVTEEGRMRRRAEEDGLTGLANRSHLERHLADLLEAGTPLAILLLDLDGFKQVNDRHGHAAGDAVLRVVARKIVGQLREGDVAGRLGGDEFAIVAPATTAEGAVAIAGRLRTSIGRPARVGEVECVVGASIGVVTAPEDGSTAEALLAAADRAMYEEKRQHHAA